MAQRPSDIEYERRFGKKPATRKREKKPTAKALALVGQEGEFSEPEGYERLTGNEMVVLEALPDDLYLVRNEWDRSGFRRGDLFICARHEFVTTEQKKRQAEGY